MGRIGIDNVPHIAFLVAGGGQVCIGVFGALIFKGAGHLGIHLILGVGICNAVACQRGGRALLACRQVIGGFDGAGRGGLGGAGVIGGAGELHHAFLVGGAVLDGDFAAADIHIGANSHASLDGGAGIRQGVVVGVGLHAAQLGLFLVGVVIGTQALALHLVHLSGVRGVHMVTTGKSGFRTSGSGAVHLGHGAGCGSALRHILGSDETAVIGQIRGLAGQLDVGNGRGHIGLDLTPQVKYTIFIKRFLAVCHFGCPPYMSSFSSSRFVMGRMSASLPGAPWGPCRPLKLTGLGFSLLPSLVQLRVHSSPSTEG